MLSRNFYRVFFLGLGIAICGVFPTYETAAQKSSTSKKGASSQAKPKGKNSTSKKGASSQAKPDAPTPQPNQKQEIEWKLYSLNGFDADCLFPSTPKMERAPGGAMFYSQVKEHTFSVSAPRNNNPEFIFSREQLTFMRDQLNADGFSVEAFKLAEANILYLEATKRSPNGFLMRRRGIMVKRPGVLFSVDVTATDEDFDIGLAKKFLEGFKMR